MCSVLKASGFRVKSGTVWEVKSCVSGAGCRGYPFGRVLLLEKPQQNDPLTAPYPKI